MTFSPRPPRIRSEGPELPRGARGLRHSSHRKASTSAAPQREATPHPQKLSTPPCQEQPRPPLPPSGQLVALKHRLAQGSAHSNHVQASRARWVSRPSQGGREPADRATRASAVSTRSPLLEWIPSCAEGADTATEYRLECWEPAPGSTPRRSRAQGCPSRCRERPSQPSPKPATAPWGEWIPSCVEDPLSATGDPISGRGENYLGMRKEADHQLDLSSPSR